MNINELTPMIKVEVVTSNLHAAFVEQLLTAEGAVGWTAIHGLSGLGHSGRHDGRLLFNEDLGNVMVVAVLPPDKAPGVLAGLREFLDGRGGVAFVSETRVLRPEHFAAGSGADAATQAMATS